MIIPTFVQERLVDDQGFLTKPWQSLFEQLLQNMQQNLSEMGIVTPSQDSSNLAVIQNKLNPDGSYIVQNGTLVFNTSSVNGGSSGSPNGQLYIRLADNTFHPITNT